MAVEFKQVNAEPIYYGVYDEPQNPVQDSQHVADKLSEVINSTTGPLVFIWDLSKITVSFSDLVIGLNDVFKRDAETPFTHPRVRAVTVSNDELVHFGTEAVGQEQYGQADVKLVASLDEAIAFARQYLAEQAA
ncbi:MAG: hypothetical protein GYB67_18760 [Chloroflexi bacterium]|nr:hypothetical protein [Chloroflexota bacterium]